MQNRKRERVKPHTAYSWKRHLRWFEPRLGAVPLSAVNNLIRQGLVTEISEANFSPKTILNYVQVVKMVVASAIGQDGEEIYSRKWNHEFIDATTQPASDSDRNGARESRVPFPSGASVLLIFVNMERPKIYCGFGSVTRTRVLLTANRK